MKIACMFITPNGEPEQLATLELPAVPRVGEKVKLKGPEFGNMAQSWVASDGRVFGEERFMVFDVEWGDDGPEIYLAVEPTSSIVAPWCACTPKQREKHGMTRNLDGNALECNDCGRPVRLPRPTSASRA